MYRAFGLKAVQAGVSLEDEAALVELSTQTTIQLEPTEAGNRVLLDGTDVTTQLRDPSVSDAASRVSSLSPIRAWLVSLQQQMGAQGGVVMEGRDIGTVVFPKADVKIFLDADASVRGLRRVEQMGDEARAQAEAIIRDLKERDQRDRTRADSPLKPAEDAILLDSTSLTLDEVIREAERIVASRCEA